MGRGLADACQPRLLYAITDSLPAKIDNSKRNIDTTIDTTIIRILVEVCEMYTSVQYCSEERC